MLCGDFLCVQLIDSIDHFQVLSSAAQTIQVGSIPPLRSPISIFPWENNADKLVDVAKRREEQRGYVDF